MCHMSMRTMLPIEGMSKRMTAQDIGYRITSRWNSTLRRKGDDSNIPFGLRAAVLGRFTDRKAMHDTQEGNMLYTRHIFEVQTSESRRRRALRQRLRDAPAPSISSHPTPKCIKARGARRDERIVLLVLSVASVALPRSSSAEEYIISCGPSQSNLTWYAIDFA